jgi:hypothetical protein
LMVGPTDRLLAFSAMLVMGAMFASD